MGVRLEVGGDLSASDLRLMSRKESDGKVVARLLAIASALDGQTRKQAANQAGMDWTCNASVPVWCLFVRLPLLRKPVG